MEAATRNSKMMTLLWKAYFSLPPTMRVTLRSLLKGGSGHRSSLFNSMIAKRDAHGKCRLDKTARLFSQYLSSSGVAGVENLRCLEIGTGYVGATPLVMWLLGAAAVTSIDLNRLLALDAMKESIRLTDRAALFALLKPHVTSEAALKERLLRIYAWLESSDGNFPEGINYVAPCDLLTYEFDSQFDLIFSVSTLEHIPRSLVGRFVGSMAALLAKGGVCLHAIDLTDHLDSACHPLAFLSVSTTDYCEDSNADARGNRIRGPEWLEIFTSAGLKTSIAWSESTTQSQLPKYLAHPFDRMEKRHLLLTSVLTRSEKA